VDHDGGGAGADEVAGVDQRPIAQQAPAGESPVGPGEDDQAVSGEQLRPADQDQDQAERERDPAQEALGAEAQSALGDHHGVERRAEGDEGAGEDRQHQRRDGRERRLGHAGGLDPLGDLGRRVGVEAVELGQIWLASLESSRASIGEPGCQENDGDALCRRPGLFRGRAC
jgi:hypothetical protein